MPTETTLPPSVNKLKNQAQKNLENKKPSMAEKLAGSSPVR